MDECNNLHESFKAMGLNCDICGMQLNDTISFNSDCCNDMDVILDEGQRVCINCGSVHFYEMVSQRTDFYERPHLIRKASRYHRKYYLRKRKRIMKQPSNVQISWHDLNKMEIVFDLIVQLHKKLNRIRLIHLSYILDKLYEMIGIERSFLKKSSSQKTLKGYQRYWDWIMDQRGDEIRRICSA